MDRRKCFSVAAAGLVLGALVGAAPAGAAPAEPRRAPSGASFYIAPSPLPGKRHGDLIWSRDASRAEALANASSNRLVLYRSSGVAGRIAVSGMVSVPRGRPPRGGWPVITWAHGTTGIADRCAPTRNPRLVRYGKPLYESWLKRGYAVVATDYEGLGTPSYVHPYLNGPSEGRGVLDIVRAARRLDRRIGRRMIVSGISQGGTAALFAASLAPRYTPELNVRGTVAFSPGSHVGEQLQLPREVLPTAPNPSLSAVLMLTARGLEVTLHDNPSLDVRAGLSDIANARYGQLDRLCLKELEKPGSFGDIAPADLYKPDGDPAPFIPTVERFFDPENLTIRTPVRIDVGTADTTTLPFYTEQMVADYRARGTRVTYAVHEGVSHTGVLKTHGPTAWISRHLR
jgi:dienelactone hydrolase